MNNLLLSRKWSKFLRYRRFFSFVPFLDFVIIAGSLALGNVHENSDFDVIVGVRAGRIFTVRAFCLFIFGALGLRRKGKDGKAASSDKVCFSHFVTPAAYRLSPPYNDYWRALYHGIAPVYGREKAVREFFKANDWVGGKPAADWKRFKPTIFNPARIFLEFVLHEFLGDIFEKFVKKIQLERIKKSLKRDAGYKPRLRYDDEELEFHPDTRRIEEMLKQ